MVLITPHSGRLTGKVAKRPERQKGGAPYGAPVSSVVTVHGPLVLVVPVRIRRQPASDRHSEEGILACQARYTRILRNLRSAGSSPSVVQHPGATLLGPQNGQRVGQVAQAVPARGEAQAARDLDSRYASARQRGVRPIREDLRGEYPKAVECLVKDWDVLLTFYDLPADH